MNLTEEYKEKILKEIVETMISAIENKALYESEAPLVSDFVLKNIDTIKTHQQLIEFLEELVIQWPFFEHILAFEKGEERGMTEHEVAEGVAMLAKEGKIDTALSLAKTMTKN